MSNSKLSTSLLPLVAAISCIFPTHTVFAACSTSVSTGQAACSMTSNQNVDVTPTGSLSGGGVVNGIDINAITVGTITNAGLIEGNQTGIFSKNNGSSATDVVMGGINNQSGGTIHGNLNVGIHLNQTKLTGGIRNTGTISGGDLGIILGSNTNIDYIHNAQGGTIKSTDTRSGRIALALHQATLKVNPGDAALAALYNAGTISSEKDAIRIQVGSTIAGDETRAGLLNVGQITSKISDAIRIGGDSGAIATLSNGLINEANAEIKAGDRGIKLGVGSAGVINGGIRNAGTINATNVGLEVGALGTLNGGLNNQGSISSAVGVKVNSAGTLAGGIQNSGTITGTVQALDLQNTTGQIAVTNTGVLDGAVSLGKNQLDMSGTGKAVGTVTTSSGAQITLRDDAKIQGNLALNGAATLNLNDKAQITGTLQGNGAGIVNLNRDLTTTSSITGLAQLNVASGKTLDVAHDLAAATLRNDGRVKFGPQMGKTLTGSLDNRGVLEIAHADQVRITGDYTQALDGSLQIYAASTSSYSRVQVDGVASLPTAAKIDVKVDTVNSIQAGQTLAGVLTASSLNASTFAVSDNSALFDFVGVKNGNQVDLTIKKAIDVVTPLQKLGKTQTLPAAEVLDQWLGQPAVGDKANVVTALGKLPTEQSVVAAVQQTLPLLSGGQAQTTRGSMEAASRIIQARQSGNRGISTGDDYVGSMKAWAKPFASRANQQDQQDISGFKANSYGLILGSDSEYSATTRLGGALVYAQSNIESNALEPHNEATVNSYQAVVYGTYAIDASTEFFWQGDLGLHRNDGQRKITFGGLNRTAQADYDSYSAHLGGGVARTFQFGELTTVAPSLRLDYLYFHERAYTETGADALNLQVDAKTTDQLTLRAEAKLTHALSDQVGLLANVGAGFDALSNSSTLRAAYVGGGAAFNTSQLDAGRFVANAGLGFVSHLGKGLELTVRYDLEGREDYLLHTASAKIRGSF